MIYKYAFGGIGDMLQCIESAIQEQTIDIYSHYSLAPDIFTKFGVNINRFEHFSELDFFISSQPLERHFYPKFDVPSPILKKNNKKTIGVHIEGSAFSNQFYSRLGLIDKNMSLDFLDNLLRNININHDVHFYIFCSPSRRVEIDLFLESKITNYTMIAFCDIWDSLSCVQNCDFVVGMDSCIKTMANIRRIPSLVFVGNYEDKYRDVNFLDQYVKDGHMQIIKFSNLEKLNICDILSKIKI